MTASCLTLRLASPLQSWGSSSRFARRETDHQPTKSGVVGLLAAADGRRRADPIVDLAGLRFGVRTDQPGTLLRDYHTVSDYRGQALPTAEVRADGRQKLRGKSATTVVTERFYLSDAVFVAVLEGDPVLLGGLATAILHPTFPLALGRRACVPTQPLLLTDEGEVLWDGTVNEVLGRVGWQASKQHQRERQRLSGEPELVRLPVAVDDPTGTHTVRDTPETFAPGERSYVTRRVRHGHVTIPTDVHGDVEPQDVTHNPFALL